MALRHIHIRLATAAYYVALCVMLAACSSPRPQSSRDVVVTVGTPAYKTLADARADKVACDAASGPYPRPWYECMQQRGYEVIAYDVNGKPISLSRLEGPPYQAHAAATMSINPSVTTTVPPPAPTVPPPTQSVPMTSGSASPEIPSGRPLLTQEEFQNLLQRFPEHAAMAVISCRGKPELERNKCRRNSIFKDEYADLKSTFCAGRRLADEVQSRLRAKHIKVTDQEKIEFVRDVCGPASTAVAELQ
jgi:hypothetical protein